MLNTKNLLAVSALLALAACGKTKSVHKSADATQMEQSFTSALQDKVYFAFDKASLSHDAKSTLDTQVEWIKTNSSSAEILVEGHCDARGPREYNIALGEKRAFAAKSYLVDKGIPAHLVSTVSFGKEKPAVEGNDEAAYQANRRAVTVIK